MKKNRFPIFYFVRIEPKHFIPDNLKPIMIFVTVYRFTKKKNENEIKKQK